MSIQVLLKYVKRLFDLGISYEQARVAGNTAEVERIKRIVDRIFEEVDRFYEGD